MTIICVTGMPGAGKGEVVKVLVEKKGLPVVRMGGVVWDFVQAAGLPLEPAVVGPFANSEREKHGTDIWARRTVERVKLLEEDDVVIDGVRAQNEIRVFKEAFGDDLVLVCVTAPRAVRLERILARGREDDTATEESFDQRDRRELSWGLQDVIDMADVTIENQSGLEELQARVEKIIGEVFE